MGMLRRIADVDTMDQLWALAQAAGDGSRRCPACERPMKAAAIPTGTGSLPLDVCIRCYFVWFAAGEFEALPPPRKSPKTAEHGLPLEARLMLAKLEVENLDHHPGLELPPDAPPPEGWKAIPAFFGLPVQEDSAPLVRQPWGAWMLGGTVAMFSLLALLDLRDVARDFGLVPTELWRYGGLTLLTSFFLHGSLPHLAGNVYFLIAFGDDVEDYLGTTAFLLLLAAATVSGGLVHKLFHANAAVPLIGASAAISGMLTCYGLQFPRARIDLLLRLPQLFLMRWISLRAWAFVLVWIVLQGVGAWRQTGPFIQVSLLAHLGGAAAGFLFWFFWPAHRAPALDNAPASSEPQN